MSRPSAEPPRLPLQIGSPSAGERRLLLSVVVPCMNEEQVLRETSGRLVEVLEGVSLNFEILYVDDGSTDSTPELVR